MTSLRAVIALLLAFSPAAAAAEPPPDIAAAADLRLALPPIAAAFRRDTGRSVRLTFGSSGAFTQQIRRGAPFQLFLSADERYVADLARAGRTADAGALYAVGRLAIVARHGSPLRVDGDLSGLRAALSQGTITRFAIANPTHAPYGERAREALRHAGLWRALGGKIVTGENAAQALRFATAGGAQGGIISYALVLDPNFAARARYALIPAAFHTPLRQRMVLTRRAGPTARRFYAYLRQPAARRILVRYGFELPAER